MALWPMEKRTYRNGSYWATLTGEDTEIALRISHAEYVNGHEHGGPAIMDEMEKLRQAGLSPRMRVIVLGMRVPDVPFIKVPQKRKGV